MKYLLLILTTTFQIASFTQEIEWEPTTKEVVVTNSDSTIRARVLIQRNAIKTSEELRYYWHSKGIINSNMGDFTGELLHGKYLVLDKAKNLITKGSFSNGLKTGTWRKWQPNGILIYIAEYREGLLHGEYVTYNNLGQVENTQIYKDGIEDIKQERKPVFQKNDKADIDTETPNIEIPSDSIPKLSGKKRKRREQKDK